MMTNFNSNTMTVVSEIVDKNGQKCYDKIRSDTFRTFRDEAEFHARVQEAALVRVLNSYGHKYGEILCM